MEYRKLEYFLRVCEAGSISRAAAKLFISQQALSKSIDSLERELGLPLFYRTPQGLALTQYGEALRRDGTLLLDRHDELLEHLAALRREHEQRVSISFFSGMLIQYPEQFFERFISRHRDTRFHFYSYADTDHGRRFANTNVDLFFSTNALTRPDMRLLYEYSSPLGVLLSPAHPLASQSEVSLDDLRGQNIISINSDFETQDMMREEFDRRGIVVQSFLSDAEQAFSYAMVRQCQAVIFFAGPDEMVPPGTVRLPLEQGRMAWRFYIYGRMTCLPRAANDLVQEIMAFRQRP